MLNMLYFYGIIILQIVSESFPVSSSGHVVLWQRMWSTFYPAVLWDNQLLSSLVHNNMVFESIIHFLHGPTIIAVVIIFFDSMRYYLRAMYRDQKFLWKALIFIGIADGITVAFYVFFKWIIAIPFSLAFGFWITALALLSLRTRFHISEHYSLVKSACILGVMQGLALLPGISRLGMTFFVAYWLGFAPVQALEISWALQLPLIAAAWLKSCVILYLHNGFGFLMVPYVGSIIFGATVCAVIGLWIFRWLITINRAWVVSLYVMLIALIASYV